MLNAFDICITVLAISLAILGFREGFVRSALKLVGFIASIMIVSMLTDVIHSFADMFPGIPRQLAVVVVFIAAVAAGTIIVHIAAAFLHKIIHMTPAGFIDSGLGTAFGILKAFIFGGILAIALSFSPDGTFIKQQYENSVSARHLVSFISETIPYVNRFTPYYKQLTPEISDPEQNQNGKRIPSDII